MEKHACFQPLFVYKKKYLTNNSQIVTVKAQTVFFTWAKQRKKQNL